MAPVSLTASPTAEAWRFRAAGARFASRSSRYSDGRPRIRSHQGKEVCPDRTTSEPRPLGSIRSYTTFRVVSMNILLNADDVRSAWSAQWAARTYLPGATQRSNRSSAGNTRAPAGPRPASSERCVLEGKEDYRMVGGPLASRVLPSQSGRHPVPEQYHPTRSHIRTPPA